VIARLRCTGIDAGYGAASVVRCVDLEIEAGKVVAVLGPNGAGKTTFLLSLAGLLPRTTGDVFVDEVEVPSFRPSAANKAGIVLVPDDRALFASLTVEENLRAACQRRSRLPDEVAELFPSLRTRWTLVAGALSGGEQQMLAVARALVQEPKVLLIDEMSMGLAPIIVEQLLPQVRTIADTTGAVVVLVEQHVHLALDIADEAIVLSHGKVELRGPAAALAADAARLEAAYLGGGVVS
jgi:branched-chain amino acid transport system ATP-binding protein